jgi:hypothetical protein
VASQRMGLSLKSLRLGKYVLSPLWTSRPFFKRHFYHVRLNIGSVDDFGKCCSHVLQITPVIRIMFLSNEEQL